MKKRYTEEQIVQILRDGEMAGNTTEVCRTYGISEWTYYRWKRRYAGLEVNERRRLRALAVEHTRLKQMVADQALATQTLREILEKRGLQCRRGAGPWRRWFGGGSRSAERV